MSRFRFRVYDKINNRYVDGSPDCYFIDQLGDLIKISEHDDHLDRVQDKDNFIVEQCTGLRDKNGVLIYEGDVVLCGILGDRGHTVEAVVDCVYPFDDTIEWRCMYIDSTGVSKSKGQSLHAELCTVISNIHDREVKDESN